MGLSLPQIDNVKRMITRFVHEHEVITASIAFVRAVDHTVDPVSRQEVIDILTGMCREMLLVHVPMDISSSKVPRNLHLYVRGPGYDNLFRAGKNPSPDFSYGKPDGGESVVRETVEAVPTGDVTKYNLLCHLRDAERRAWQSLSRYKFQQFGYWCAIWVHLNRIGGFKKPNPWSALVNIARGVD